MRIFSWNVNGIRAAEKKGLINWMIKEDADIVCFQETKARPDQLSIELREICDKNGKPYYTYWASAEKPGYSGVAIYSKTEPLNIENLGVKEFDTEGRVLQAEYKGFILITCYFPNSQDERRRLDYKLKFCDAIMNLCKKYRKEKRNFVINGDFNIAHTPIDLARPKENENSAGYLLEERAWMDSFISEGFIDTFRLFHPGEKGHYSWWSYRVGVRERNIGWRIDYHCINPEFIPSVTTSTIHPEVFGSDHCPIELNLNS